MRTGASGWLASCANTGTVTKAKSEHAIRRSRFTAALCQKALCSVCAILRVTSVPKGENECGSDFLALLFYVCFQRRYSHKLRQGSRVVIAHAFKASWIATSKRCWTVT